MDDFTKQVQERFSNIEKQEAAERQKLDALAAEKAPLAAYLVKAGVLKVKQRAKRKAAPASTGAA